MTGQPAWDAHSALANIELQAWSGRAWRFHRQVYEATDASGSRIVSGRYHRASDLFPPAETWPALYLALAPETALAEVLRHFSPELTPRINGYRLTEMEVSLSAVLDCRDPARIGIALDDLTRDYDFAVPQAIAAAALVRDAEALLIPSATALGDNIVVFPEQLRSSSQLAVIASRAPRLFVRR